MIETTTRTTMKAGHVISDQTLPAERLAAQFLIDSIVDRDGQYGLDFLRRLIDSAEAAYNLKQLGAADAPERIA